MTALQKIAMGLVIVVIHADFGGWDGVPDPLGWILVILGLRGLAGAPPVLTLLAALAEVASIVSFPPALLTQIPDSGQWMLTLPQTAFVILLALTLPEILPEVDRRRFLTVAGLLIISAAGLLVRYGADVDALDVPVSIGSVVANVWLIYLLFRPTKSPTNRT